MKDFLSAATVYALDAEVERARTKFPKPDCLTAALLEEIGEWAKEAPNSENARKELLQVACVALRIYEEGDPRADEQMLRNFMALIAPFEDYAREVLRAMMGEGAAAKSDGR